MRKEKAVKVEIKALDFDTHWSGMILVNDSFVSEASGPSFYGVLDAILEGAFDDGVGSEAVYAVDDAGVTYV